MAIKFHEEAVPSPRTRDSSPYYDAMRDFMDTGMESARIDAEDRSLSALVSGLKYAIESTELRGHAKVACRRGRVYIVRTDDESM